MHELNIDELHDIQLDMLKAFDSFCETNRIDYYLAYGTLIGAIRNNGFIPWDDDVDVFMMRKDYEKLIEFSKINDRYLILTYENQQGYYHPFTYCNIADTKTIMKEDAINNGTGKGVFIDVFPLDKIPNNRLKAFVYTMVMKYLIKIRSVCLMPYASKGFKKNIKLIISKFVNLDLNYKLIETNAKRYYDCDSKKVANVVHSSNPVKYNWDMCLFDNTVLHPFEDTKLKVPNGYDTVLKIIYGDYLQLPPKEERVPSHLVKYYISE